MWKKNRKKSIEKDSHTYIYSLRELICVTAQKDNITASSPLSLLTFQAVSPMSFKPAKKDREQGHFFPGQEKSWCMELLAGSRLQTEYSKSAVQALSLGMGNLTTVLHLQTIIQGFSEIHWMWQCQSPELYKEVSSLRSDLCVNGIIYWIIAAYLFPNRITMKKKGEKSAGVLLLYLRKHFKTYYFK